MSELPPEDKSQGRKRTLRTNVTAPDFAAHRAAQPPTASQESHHVFHASTRFRPPPSSEAATAEPVAAAPGHKVRFADFAAHGKQQRPLAADQPHQVVAASTRFRLGEQTNVPPREVSTLLQQRASCDFVQREQEILDGKVTLALFDAGWTPDDESKRMTHTLKLRALGAPYNQVEKSVVRVFTDIGISWKDVHMMPLGGSSIRVEVTSDVFHNKFESITAAHDAAIEHGLNYRA